MTEKVYPKGIRVFAPHEKAPSFIKGTMVITMNELFQFCKDNETLLTEYNGQKQLKLQLQDGRNGLAVVVDTYKKQGSNEKTFTSKNDDLPF